MKRIVLLTLFLALTNVQADPYFSKIQVKMTGITERQSCESSDHHLHQLSMEAAVQKARNFCTDKEGLEGVRLLKSGITPYSFDYTDICKFKKAWSRVHVICKKVTGPLFPYCQVPSPYCADGCCDRQMD